MSMKRKKAGLVTGWRKSFSMLAPWRKGKGVGDAVTGSDVVLTKMKLFNNFNERPLKVDDSVSSISMVSDNCRLTLDTIKVSEANPDLKVKPSQSQMKSSSEYLSVIFSNSDLPRLYKFESEDSGVELNSGANSPSTPNSSEKSFVVHSREPSGDSCNLNSDHTSLPNAFIINVQNSEIKQTVDNNLNTRGDAECNVMMYRDELSSPSEDTEPQKSQDEDGHPTSGTVPEVLSETEETSALTDMGCPTDIRLVQGPYVGLHDDRSSEKEPLSMRRCNTTDSLKEYMEECCRLSQTQQQSPGAISSGLSYLQHICHLVENIGKLQETNLKLQKQICSLQKDHRTTKTKEHLFQEYCSCGAASLAYQEIQLKTSRSEIFSSTGTLSDLSTIPEVIRHPLKSTRTGRGNECVASVPRWKRSLNRRSYTEGGAHFLSDSREQVSTPQRRLTENYTWGRVKDIVRRTKVGNQNRLGLTSTSLKMSCPQLYRPDLNPTEPAVRNRNSMIALGL